MPAYFLLPKNQPSDISEGWCKSGDFKGYPPFLQRREELQVHPKR